MNVPSDEDAWCVDLEFASFFCIKSASAVKHLNVQTLFSLFQTQTRSLFLQILAMRSGLFTFWEILKMVSVTAVEQQQQADEHSVKKNM